MKKSFFAFGIIICLVFYFLSTIGWWGYEKWKYRRSTFGNKTESIERKVFVKDLKYFSSMKLENFDVYIEKGFKYGYLGDYQTRILENDKYPYQISYQIEIDNDNIYGFDDDFKSSKYDSISSVYFLKTPKLEKAIIIKINKLVNKNWDYIGYIKIWDKDITAASSTPPASPSVR